MLYFLYFCFFIETKVENLFETLYMILGFFLRKLFAEDFSANNCIFAEKLSSLRKIKICQPKQKEYFSEL